MNSFINLLLLFWTAEFPRMVRPTGQAPKCLSLEKVTLYADHEV